MVAHLAAQSSSVSSPDCSVVSTSTAPFVFVNAATGTLEKHRSPGDLSKLSLLLDLSFLGVINPDTAGALICHSSAFLPLSPLTRIFKRAMLGPPGAPLNSSSSMVLSSITKRSSSPLRPRTGWLPVEVICFVTVSQFSTSCIFQVFMFLRLKSSTYY